jgi:hypothetical protein
MRKTYQLMGRHLAVPYNHKLAWHYVSDETAIQGIYSHALRGHHEAGVDFPDAKRLDAQWVAHGQDCISPQEDERIGAHELAHQSTNCFLKVIAQELFDKKVCNYFSIRCRIEYVPRLLQLLSKLTGVNQISIMCYGNSSVLVLYQQGLAIFDTRSA